MRCTFAACDVPRNRPDPPFLAFLDFLAFFLLRFSLLFGQVNLTLKLK